MEPHQRRVQFELLVHTEIERDLQRPDGLIAAIRIAGIIGLAHAADDVRDAAPVGQRSRKGQKHQIAAGHEGVGQSVFAHRDRDIARQRGVGDRGQCRNVQGVAVTEFGRPVRPQRFHALQQTVAAIKLDGMTLPVIETEHLDVRKTLQSPCETGGGILSAGEKDQRGLSMQLIAHRRALSTHQFTGKTVERAACSARFAGIGARLAAYRRELSCLRCMMTPSRDISRLLEIMAMLRTPGSGCPWDLEQNFATIAPYTIEEAYEVADAIARGDLDDLRDELGDLLLQVVFHARMAEEQHAFSFGDVVEAITAKMIRRHPHVFADKDGRLTPSDVKGAWDRIKAEEKAERAARRPPEQTALQSLLSGVKAGQPALTRAMGLQRKASSVGFDWNDPREVLRKIREEADEIEAALDRGDADELAEETGDLLFALVNLARHVGADPDMALRGTNAKFERRFGYIERALVAQGRSLESASLAEMDALWNAAKGEE